MPEFTSKERVALGKKIREGKDKFFPGRGGCGRLAGELGITPQLLSHWMSGRRLPEPAQMAALAKLFNVSILKLCSLPQISKTKGAPWSFDVAIDLLKKYKKMRLSPSGRQRFDAAIKEITIHMEKELDELLP